MKKKSIAPRKLMDRGVQVVSFFIALFSIAMLVWILTVIVIRGMSALNWSMIVNPTAPYGFPDGGLANAIVGTLLITSGAALLGVPAGLLGGIYLSEFGGSTQIGKIIRFSANVMMGIPSIIVGLFVYTLLVLPTGHFSGFAGSVALSIIMLPVVLRTTEDVLCMVPNALREAGLSMGIPRWKVTFSIIFRTAKRGLVTGVLLAVARVSGETAPLLFTALWSDSWPTRYFTQPTANMTVIVNEYATNEPFAEMHARAWTGALLITAAVLTLNIICKIFFREKKA